jgi:hypothetical protein
MMLDEPKNVMVDIDWAKNYTEYLMGIKKSLAEIDNTLL